MSGTWEELAGAGALAAVQPIPGLDVIVDVLVATAVVGAAAGSLSGDTMRGAHAKSEAQTGEKATTTPCSDCEPPDCKESQEGIEKTRNELKKRYSEMREDKHDLYNRARTRKEAIPGIGSWEGHGDQFEGKASNLRKKIIDAQTKGCSVPGDAWKWASEEPPRKPAPKPDS